VRRRPEADRAAERAAKVSAKGPERQSRCLLISEGGAATVGRWNGDGRKVEPTERFRAPHWRFIGYEHFRAKRRPQPPVSIGAELGPLPSRLCCAQGG